MAKRCASSESSGIEIWPFKMLNLHSDSRSSGDTKTFTKTCDTNMFFFSLSLSAFAKKIQKHSPHVNSQTEQIKCMYIYIIMYIIVYILLCMQCVKV